MAQLSCLTATITTAPLDNVRVMQLNSARPVAAFLQILHDFLWPTHWSARRAPPAPLVTALGNSAPRSPPHLHQGGRQAGHPLRPGHGRVWRQRAPRPRRLPPLPTPAAAAAAAARRPPPPSAAQPLPGPRHVPPRAAAAATILTILALRPVLITAVPLVCAPRKLRPGTPAAAPVGVVERQGVVGGVQVGPAAQVTASTSSCRRKKEKV